jgi:GTP-binding protein
MDCWIEVPLGTVLWETRTEELIRELLQPGEEVVVARGGAGGIGNGRRGSRTAFHQESLEGSDGEKRALRLELKLLADVGIVGMPNAGKSTLIRQISQARPRVAPFPFTTTSPVLGAVELASGKRIVAVDVPGLIEGAHRGKGLGLTFLRHIERTRLLVHLVDMAGMEGRDPIDDYHVFNTELRAYHPAVVEKAQIVVANKMDSPQASENLARFRRRVKVPVTPISAATGDGVQRLLKRIEAVIGKK